jgi:hypothetical protein
LDSIAGIVKLEDANNAGGRNAKQCTLILTEGDSAKALAVSGLSVVGRDHYGVFPLRGKLLNVREAGHDQIVKNVELQHIKQIMGLKHNQEYSSVDGLRYGKLMIMTDQVRIAAVASVLMAGSRWFAYQGFDYQFPRSFLPFVAQDSWLPCRIHHPNC